MNPAPEERRIAAHIAVVDDGDIGGKSKRAAEDLIDDAIVPICFIDRWHDEHCFDAVAGSDGPYGPHLAGNFKFVAGAQATFGFSERVFILNDECFIRLPECRTIRTNGSTLAPSQTE